MNWVTGIGVAVGLMAVAEYVAHRWWMHAPRGLGYFQEHAVEHHAKRRHDINLDLPVSTNLYYGLPIAAVLLFAGVEFAACLTAILVVHAQAWTALHRSFHSDAGWVKRLPLWGILYRHHMEHHRRPGRNFGAVFGPAVDLVFGTWSRP